LAQTLKDGSPGGVEGCGIKLNCIGPIIVIPAKAGIPLLREERDPRFRGDDELGKREG
jgi:hypothetical protein